MASSRGRQDPPVADRLFDAGYEFSFFQAVRLLGRISGGGMFSRLNFPIAPSREIVRFDVHQSLGFPPSAIHRLLRAGPERPPYMSVAFFGLTGSLGVLPLFYTEAIRQRARSGDTSGAAFLDIFNHRLISFFYYAWEKHHPAVTWERERDTALRSGLPQYLFDLVGMGTHGLRNRTGFPDRVLLLYAGLLSQKPRSASALAGLLRDHFGVPVHIEQFRGKWLTLADEDLSWMTGDGVHNQLGVGAIAGTEVWNQQAGFRVVVGPLRFHEFLQFLPEGRAFHALGQLTSFFVDQALDFDVQLLLFANDVPECRLNSGALDEPRLGLSSWLKTEPFEHAAGDAILSTEITGRAS